MFAEDKLPPVGDAGKWSASVHEKEGGAAPMGMTLPLTCDALIQAQKDDHSLATCFAAVNGQEARARKQSYLLDDGLLVRKWVPQGGAPAGDTGEDWKSVHQIVIPAGCRQHVLALAHEHLWSGHLGVTKTYNRILKHVIAEPAILAN